MDRHIASLEANSLGILHKCSTAYGYGIDDSEVKVEFLKLIPTWNELNRKLFWFESQRSRETLDKKRGERLTSWWNVSLYGRFWQFEESDFEYITEQISSQEFLDNKLIALSLAFHLYKMANRPRRWRMKLKRVVADNDKLSARLDNCLKPPSKSQDFRYWEKQKARHRRITVAKQKKQEKYHRDWKKFFNDSLDKARVALHDNPGILTNPLLYLFDQTQNKRSGSGRWTEYNWKTLIPEYGEEVACFYRDSTVSFWRQHKPKLRSEGAPANETPYSVIIGLIGLEIEANEIRDWPKNLTAAEAERACRYASFELNGFPTWFPRLFEKNSSIVCDFLMQEIRYELSIEKPETDTHYIISDISHSGQWSWNLLAPSIYDLIKREPKNLGNLEKLLNILQSSNLTDNSVERLASRKCHALKSIDHAARWFSVWTGVAPGAAIVALENRIAKISD
ncbi:hypothetical protein IQ273_27090 [Nodosilinea sp. LEGE 07298]|uniref:hypothetical protein n=1 Tax=Nodosilinea sp. LEGE 07298 TaxID=2777970 RepID=UPI001881966A|nr:hypothetical protein [Nodosilinea sp. LEGE 07298]MBE9113053.1 hypothetical protein [Nodosilinea sp. LEGE 07298]